jgi:hypothetical protein
MQMQDVVRVALNGDADKVDPAVRRTLNAMAAQQDEHNADMLKEVRGVRRMLTGLTGTVITGLILIVAQTLLKL